MNKIKGEQERFEKVYSSVEELINFTNLLNNEVTTCSKIKIYVEGPTDTKFLEKHLLEDVVINYAEGCSKFEEVMQYFCNDKKIIGIRDRDYMKVDSNYDKGVFYYDYNSLEIMLIMIDECYNSICYEYYNGEKRYLELRNEIFNLLKYVSSIRKYNFDNENKWNLQSISIGELHKKNMDRECILEQIKFNNLTDKQKEEIDRIYNNIKAEDLPFVTRGHDMTKLLTEFFARGKKGVSADVIESSLRVSCHPNLFKITKLYKDLKVYEEKNNFKILRG